MRVLLPLLALAAAPVVLAQSPVVTPAGDPSVRSDTIYSLAVDPARHADQPYVYLLDDGIVRLEADGRSTRTYRQVIQVLTREAADLWGEHSFSYDRSRDRLRINWVRVVRPDGEVVSEGASAEQESDAVAEQEAPVYTDQRTRRITLAGVAPGTIVDYSYTIERRQPVRAGDAWSSWSIHTTQLVRRSRLVVDAPAPLELRIRERHLDFARGESVVGGRRILVWAARDIEPFEAEPFVVPDSNGAMGVTVATPSRWADIAAWYARLARDRYSPDSALVARLSSVVAGAATLLDSVRAVHRWVSQDFRYVSLALGAGGYQPRRPSEVLATGFGDCKDKVTLFIALLSRMGVRAYPVLVASSGSVDRGIPSIGAFDHMIAAVKLGPGYLYTDLTADLVPFGSIAPVLQEEFGLLVHPDGRGEELQFPVAPAEANRSHVVVEGELVPDGSFRGRLTRTVTGSEEYSVRADLLRPLSDTERDRVARTIASGVFQGTAGDSLQLFDGRDLAVTARISVAIRGGRATERSGANDILTLPIESFSNPALVADLESRGPRLHPIWGWALFGPKIWRSEMRLVLPEGWRARLPQGVTAESVFGRYESSFTQEGRLLVAVRTLRGTNASRPATAMPELIAWLRAIADDNVRFVVLDRP